MLDVVASVSLAIEIELIELVDPPTRNTVVKRILVLRITAQHLLEHLTVFCGLEVSVGTLTVPRIERVITDHPESRLGQLGAIATTDLIEIFIMAPAHGQLVDTTASLVNTQLGAVNLHKH